MTTPLLEVNNLAKHFPTKGVLGRTTGAVKAVDGVSFTLERGTTLGLVGESGCGKSTTGKVLMRLLEPTSGSFRLDGEEISGLRGRQLDGFRRRVQMVFQNPASSLNPRQSIGAAIAAPLVEQRIRVPGGIKAKVADLMNRVGLRPEHANRFPHEFSGGQRQRIGIARALALDPDVVICDEPVSALDVSVQAQVVNLLKDIQADTGVSYIFIAHDLAVVKHMADEVAVMYLGKIMEQAPARELFADPRHPYTRALLSAVPSVDLEANLTERIRLRGDLPSPSDPPSGCVFRTRCPAYLLLDEPGRQRCAREVPTGQMACHFPEAQLAMAQSG
ncbi:peptide ABC transporter substrate-binding protein [Arthrobacter sp. MYb211]|uniref:ABC transporter ATP-binding protein n=1 Tax=unclassified Arthrobacter TaxID=235627 RepID=UPI000CFAA88A|nr:MULTISPECIES: oligopeptide/dipeptide ABC transporter ATP-binding protein [unclassified Arthrobacter]PRA10598.1 peptide ABC transporter substrate-binding protein [Arthrobacter sp. MYb221]PRC06286.1 peptide ABC transporter substrate-binding protein [Arthrobacter sp. MYb211]